MRKRPETATAHPARSVGSTGDGTGEIPMPCVPLCAPHFPLPESVRRFTAAEVLASRGTEFEVMSTASVASKEGERSPTLCPCLL
jgi:hypothetical protein